MQEIQRFNRVLKLFVLLGDIRKFYFTFTGDGIIESVLFDL